MRVNLLNFDGLMTFCQPSDVFLAFVPASMFFGIQCLVAFKHQHGFFACLGMTQTELGEQVEEAVMMGRAFLSHEPLRRVKSLRQRSPDKALTVDFPVLVLFG